MGKKRKLSQADIKLDLTPMIDVIFLLIIFFILAGKITAEISNENITVPPTVTAEKIEIPKEYQNFKIEVYGNTQRPKEGESGMTIEFGLNPPWHSHGSDPKEDAAMFAYRRLREQLDTIYDQADYYQENGKDFPLVKLELRADSDTEYRVIQEIQQIAADANDPFNEMKPKVMKRPFVEFHFTTRKPGE